MTWPDWAQFGATILLGVIALLVALFGPYIGDRFKKQRLAPRLHIEFSNSAPYCHRTKQSFQNPYEEFDAYYFTFSIQNQGESQARSCEVVLEEVYTADENHVYRRVKEFWPTNLRLQGDLHMDINPGRPPVYVAIGHISEPECQERRERPYSVVTDASDYHRFIFDYHGGQRRFFQIDSRPRGRHLFKLAIAGENFATVTKRFELHWTGKWSADEDEMLAKDAVITMLE